MFDTHALEHGWFHNSNASCLKKPDDMYFKLTMQSTFLQQHGSEISQQLD